MKKITFIFIAVLITLLGNCSTLPEKPPTREPVPDFEVGCQNYRGTERNRCIQNLLKELEDLRNPDNPIRKTEISRERYNEYWVSVQTKYCLSKELCFVDQEYEFKPSLWTRVKEYGVVAGVSMLITLFL